MTITEGATITMVLEPGEHDQVARSLAARKGISFTEAGRVIRSAVYFLHLRRYEPGVPYAPSPLVDEGWHELVLHTEIYFGLSERICGEYIHHKPPLPGVAPSLTIQDTIDAMIRHGLPYLPDLWDTAANCCTARGSTM